MGLFASEMKGMPLLLRACYLAAETIYSSFWDSGKKKGEEKGVVGTWGNGGSEVAIYTPLGEAAIRREEVEPLHSEQVLFKVVCIYMHSKVA